MWHIAKAAGSDFGRGRSPRRAPATAVPRSGATVLRGLSFAARPLDRPPVPIDQLYRAPGNTPHIDTVLEAGELIVSVLLPTPPAGRQVYRKVRDRASYAFALVSVAAILDVAGDRVRAGRVAFGGLSYKPWRSVEAEAALVGAPATRAAFDAVGTAALRDARGYGHNDFKIPLARRTLRATLTQAAAQPSQSDRRLIAFQA
jgi:xanthine dehydrogenase YagS FAD-binding subunit